MRPWPRRRASVIEYSYVAALAALAALGLLAGSPTPPELAGWEGPFPVVDAADLTAGGVSVDVFETIDIEVLLPAPRGDPFDARAVASFENTGTGETYEVQAFYDGGRGGLAVYRFRFTGLSEGDWRLTTQSSLPELDGLTGSVSVMPGDLSGPLLGEDGRFVITTPSGSRRPTTYNVFGGPLEDLAELPRDEEALEEALAPFLDEAVELGFDAVHVAVYNEWLSLGARRWDTHASVQPDPGTFRLLETLLAMAHERGLFVHFWQWGDESRRYTPLGLTADPLVQGDGGGVGGAVFARLQRYVGARLGPLPNWTMSYGFDLDEWADEPDVRDWSARLEAAMPLPHLLTATEESAGSRAFDLGEEKLSLVSRDLDPQELEPDAYELAVRELERARGQPLLLEARYLYDPDGPWDMTATRRGLWRLAMAGGAGALWAYQEDVEGGYALPEQLVTFDRFWDGRMLPGTAESRRPGTGVFTLLSSDGLRGVVYAEDAGVVPVPASAQGATLVAVDTQAPYEEIRLEAGDSDADDEGSVDDGRNRDGRGDGDGDRDGDVRGAGSWQAPYVSDWALAFEAP